MRSEIYSTLSSRGGDVGDGRKEGGRKRTESSLTGTTSTLRVAAIPDQQGSRYSELQFNQKNQNRRQRMERKQNLLGE